MNEQRVTSVDGTSWAPATGGLFADDTPFGSVLGDPLMGPLMFDVSVLDATPGTQPEDDVLFQDRAGLSDEERAQVSRADRIKEGAARRDAAHRQTHRQTRGPARGPQPPQQQVLMPGVPQYGNVPTAPPAFQQQGQPIPAQYGQRAQYGQQGGPVPAQYGQPVRQPAPVVPRQHSRRLAHTMGRPAADPFARRQKPRSRASEQKKTGPVPRIGFAVLGFMLLLRACAG
ncbi:hypothetical protein [Actinomyces respiraculi]|uniref:hypothetical protein n=1 Tax=Actinomyces respiraculi TaxID=2744574 RepID=UPI0018E08C7D|nr:hypothetical protein [Actinomyces respiraculi]